MPPSSVEVSRSPARPRARRILRALAQNFGLVLAWVVLVVAVIVYCIIYFAQQGVLPGNFEATSTINNTMPLVLTALGQTIVILTRGLDLSVGGIIDLTNALAALNFADNPGTMILWTVLILLTGAVLGLINGALVAIGRLQPIVVTIATLSIYQGLAIMVLPQPGGAIPPAFTSILVNDTAPWAGLYCVGFALLWMALRRSRLGVALYAVGNDPAAATAHGISIVRTRLLAYTMSGVAAAAAGLFLAASSTAGDATTGDSYTLSSIVAVVLGGVSLFGGRGSGIGAIAGALLTTMIVNILFFAQIDPLYQSFYEGLFLVIAVVSTMAIGRLIKRRR
jgi:ribose transport system permease protein